MNNYSTIDEEILSKRDPTLAQEDLLRFLHPAEASSLFVIGRLRTSEVKESKLTTNLHPAKKENEDLRAELLKFKHALKDKDSKLIDLHTKFDELRPQVKTLEVQVSDLTAKCKTLEDDKEELADQVCSMLKQGFQLALDQVKVL